MRTRGLLIVASLLLPVIAQGQITRRRPPISRPPEPASLPPLAPGIKDERLYQSSKFFAQTYPLIGIVQMNHYVTENIPTNYLMQGEGIRVEWRGTPSTSIGADFTSSLFGAPFMVNTLELGGRWRPESDGSARPYFDLRSTYGMVYDGYASPYIFTSGIPGDAYQAGRSTSQGFGLVAGTGFDSPLTRWMSLTGGLSFGRYHMSNVRISGRSAPQYAFDMNVIRLNFGLTYNPHHLITR